MQTAVLCLMAAATVALQSWMRVAYGEWTSDGWRGPCTWLAVLLVNARCVVCAAATEQDEWSMCLEAAAMALCPRTVAVVDSVITSTTAVCVTAHMHVRSDSA